MFRAGESRFDAIGQWSGVWGIIGAMNLENLKKVKYWGASTSAHQVEGGNHNQWSVWELESASELAANSEKKYAHWLPRWDDIKAEAQDPKNYVSGKAADHYNLYEQDFDLLEKLNMNAFRFSIEWSRVEPEEGQWDEKEIEHYRKYLRSLKSRGIEPMVTMWHWTMPVWFTQMGDFEKRSNIKYFERYVTKMMQELGEHINYVTTLNEPNVYVGMSYGQNTWPPQDRGTYRLPLVYWNLIRTHKKAYKAIKKVKPTAQIGIAQHLTYFYSGDEKFISRTIVKIAGWFMNWMFFSWSRATHDFIGLNYYQTNRIIGFRVDNEDKKRSDYGWEMLPGNVEHLLVEAHQRYDKPIMIMENGLADAGDKDRKWWLEEMLKAIDNASAKGANIEGYMYWSLLDNFEWADGFWPRFGLVEVDYKTQKRTIRASAKWFGEQIKKIRS